MAIETTYSQAREKLASEQARRGEGLEMSVEELRRVEAVLAPAGQSLT
jgi:hypothetical protein